MITGDDNLRTPGTLRGMISVPHAYCPEGDISGWPLGEHGQDAHDQLSAGALNPSLSTDTVILP